MSFYIWSVLHEVRLGYTAGVLRRRVAPRLVTQTTNYLGPHFPPYKNSKMVTTSIFLFPIQKPLCFSLREKEDQPKPNLPLLFPIEVSRTLALS